MKKTEPTDEEKLRFALFVKKRRQELNLSAESLSILALGHRSHNYIYDIESGRRLPTYVTMLKIMTALNCSVEFVRNETKK